MPPGCRRRRLTAPADIVFRLLRAARLLVREALPELAPATPVLLLIARVECHAPDAPRTAPTRRCCAAPQRYFRLLTFCRRQPFPRRSVVMQTRRVVFSADA
jgi:hypothetical protein